MASGTRPPPSQPLTLKRLMGAIAAAALSFALLPMDLAVALTVAVCGVVVLDGMRLPVVTDKGGVWTWLSWAVWLLFLMACPIAIGVVAAITRPSGPPTLSGPLPWAARIIEGLGYAQAAVSVAAAITVVVLTRGVRRWLAWAGILLVGALAWLMCFGALMDITGNYL
jgi:hypothetical protein